MDLGFDAWHHSRGVAAFNFSVSFATGFAHTKNSVRLYRPKRSLEHSCDIQDAITGPRIQ